MLGYVTLYYVICNLPTFDWLFKCLSGAMHVVIIPSASVWGNLRMYCMQDMGTRAIKWRVKQFC